MAPRVVKQCLRCGAVGVVLVLCGLALAHVILDATSGWYQSTWHSWLVAYHNSTSWGFEEDSLYIHLVKDSTVGEDIVAAYPVAYTGTLLLMRGLYPGLYRHNEILRGISYERCGDSVCFTMTDRFAGRNAAYRSCVYDGRMSTLTRTGVVGECDVRAMVFYGQDTGTCIP